MPVYSQKNDNLLNGVSQRDERLRDASQATEQVNGWSDPSSGLRKRPPSQFVAELDSDVAAHASAFIHTIDRSLDDKYRIIIRNGDLKAYNAITGAEVTVQFPDGKAYLAGTNYRAVSIEDETYIVDQDVATRRGTTIIAEVRPQALVWVRAAAEGIGYTLDIDDGAYVAEYTLEPKKSDSVKSDVDTASIANALAKTLLNTSGFSTDFTLTQVGSSFFIWRIDEQEFQIKGTDGLGDQGMAVVKDTVQNFVDLPPRALEGFVVEVIGDPGTEFDNYWLKYNQTGQETGVWIETVEPGILSDVDAATMPHELVLRGSILGENVSFGSPLSPLEGGVGGSQTPFYWDNVVHTGGTVSRALTDGTVAVLAVDSDYVEWTVDAAFEAVSTTYSLLVGPRIMDLLPANVRAYLTLGKDTGAVADIATVDVSSHTSRRKRDVLFTTTQTLAAGDKLRLTLTFVNENTGATVSDPDSGEVYINGDAYAGVAAEEPIKATSTAQGTLNFGVSRTYPENTQITVTLDTTEVFNYTPTVDATGPTVSAAFTALIDADAGYSATDNGYGVITMQTAAGAAPVVTSVAFDWDENTQLWVPGEDFGDLSLVGSTVNNLTDGSSAVITSVGASTITFSSGLTGGSDNNFSSGDVVDIGTGEGTYFIFRQVSWKDRGVGDEDTNPFPDFMGRTIQDLGFYQGRLAFLYEDKVFFTKSGDTTQLFRKTARQLLDSDPVGAESTLPSISAFHSLVGWNKALYAVAENGIVLLSGDPVITPQTISMDLAAEMSSDPNLRPIVVGRNLYVARQKPNGIQVMEASQVELDVIQYRDITTDIPSYMEGRPLAMAGWGNGNTLIVLPTDCSTNYLFVYRFLDSGRDRLQSSWSRWEMPPTGEILFIDQITGSLGMVVKYTDAVYLEIVRLDEVLGG